MPISRRQLRYFCAVYESGRLARAAERCNVAQSAISLHIRTLEGELGVSLFERRHRGMLPTAAGIRLHEHATDILRRFELAERDVRGLSGEVAGEVQVGLPYSVLEAIGLPLMTRSVAEHPALKVTLVESLSELAFTNLAAGKVDVALFYNPLPVDEVLTEALVEETLFCVGRRELIGDDDAPLRFLEVEELPQVVLRQGLPTRAVLARADLLRRIRRNAAVELDSINGFRKALVAGLGCAVAPKITLRDLLADGTLHARPVVEPEISRILHLGTHRQRPPTPAVEATVALVRRLVREETDAGRWSARWLGPG